MAASFASYAVLLFNLGCRGRSIGLSVSAEGEMSVGLSVLPRSLQRERCLIAGMLLCRILVNQRNDKCTWRKRSQSDRLLRLDLVTEIPWLFFFLDDVLLSVFQQPYGQNNLRSFGLHHDCHLCATARSPPLGLHAITP
jgi:hypothetical protein